MNSRITNNSNHANLTCSVCNQLFTNAHVIKCSHTFCLKCIENRQACPICSKKIDQNQLVRVDAINHMINSLVVTCIHRNSGEGCQEQFRKSEEENHLKHNCQFAPVTCKLRGCTQSMPRHLLADHKLHRCNFRPVKCPDCHAEMTFNSFSDHLKNHCVKVLIKCKWKDCNKTFTRNYLASHEASCSSRMVECEWCQTQMVFCRLKGHQSNDCENIHIKCKWTNCNHSEARRTIEQQHQVQCQWRLVKCNLCKTVELPFCEMENHLKETCEFAPQKCKWKNCKQQLPRQQLEAHQGECKYREKTCQYCAEILPQCNFERHIKIDCELAPVKCLNCSQVVCRNFMSKHFDQECQEVEVSCPITKCLQKYKRKDQDKHQQEFSLKHIVLLNQLVKSQSEELGSLKRKFEEISNSSSDMIGEDCEWIVYNFRSKRESGEPHFSDVMTLNHSNPELRYSFRLKLFANGASQKDGNVSLFYCPYPGPDVTCLKWPMTAQIHMTIVSFRPKICSSKTKIINTDELEFFKLKHNPARGDDSYWGGDVIFLSNEEFQTGAFLNSIGTMVIRVKIISQ